MSMLQEAHVGLAIIGQHDDLEDSQDVDDDDDGVEADDNVCLAESGLEGTAAAQASDFAFTKFHFLRRALLVHGHWSSSSSSCSSSSRDFHNDIYSSSSTSSWSSCISYDQVLRPSEFLDPVFPVQEHRLLHRPSKQ